MAGTASVTVGRVVLFIVVMILAATTVSMRFRDSESTPAVKCAVPEPCPLSIAASTLPCKCPICETCPSNAIELDEMKRLRTLYFELLKKSLRNFLYKGPEYDDSAFARDSPLLRNNNEVAFNTWTRDAVYSLESQSLGCHNCLRLTELLVEEILADSLTGDLAEMGVYRGGMSALMKAVLEGHNDRERSVWLYDTYAGIPKSKVDSDQVDLWKNRHSASLNEVRSLMMRYGLLDENVHFVPGDFAVSLLTDLPTFSMVRFDGDTYESTVSTLKLAYHKLTLGGFFVIDDWHLPGCRKAVLEYRHKNGIDDAIIEVMGGGNWKDKYKNAFWKVGSGPNYKGLPRWEAQRVVDVRDYKSDGTKDETATTLGKVKHEPSVDQDGNVIDSR